MGRCEKSRDAPLNDFRIVFGSNLRRLRQHQRLSQRELEGVCAVERGEVNLSIGVMERLARAVGVDVTALLIKSADAEAPTE